MTNADNKKVMNIAMVGVSPADQVAFKGYLRVLLRLDVELNWVAVQSVAVDLYVINEDFKNSASVVRMLEAHPETPILYISRSSVGEGGIRGNVLILPLKQINALNDWLHDNVTILSGLPYQKSASASGVTTISDATVSETVDVARPTISTPKLDDVVELIKVLHKRSDVLFELIQDTEVVAVIQPAVQRIWPKAQITPKASDWHLRVYGRALPDLKQAQDLNQWLFLAAFASADSLLPLVDNSAHYQLRSWAKPEDDKDRKALLQIMTAMEHQARTVDEVASRAGVHRLMVQKTIVALLVADHLSEPSYKDVSIHAVPSIPDIAVNQPVNVPPPVSTPEHTEKLGFLSRLRRKLGL